MSQPTCPTRSFETQPQYRMERRGGGARKVEVVRERMYVGGLNPEVTGELLAEVFSQFGLVRTMSMTCFIDGVKLTLSPPPTLLNHMLLR